MAPLPRQARTAVSVSAGLRLLKVLRTYCATYKLADTWGRRQHLTSAHISAPHSCLGSWPLSAALRQPSPDRSYTTYIHIHNTKARICFSSIHSGRISMTEAILKKAWRNPGKKTANCTSELLNLTCSSNFPALVSLLSSNSQSLQLYLIYCWHHFFHFPPSPVFFISEIPT